MPGSNNTRTSSSDWNPNNAPPGSPVPPRGHSGLMAFWSLDEWQLLENARQELASRARTVPQAPLSQHSIPRNPVRPIPLPQTSMPQVPMPQVPMPQVPMPQVPTPRNPVRPIPLPQVPMPQLAMPQVPIPELPIPELPMPLPPTNAAQISLLLPAFVGELPKVGRCRCLWPPWVDPAPEEFGALDNAIYDEAIRVFSIPVFITVLHGESRDLEPADHPFPRTGIEGPSWMLTQICLRRAITRGDPYKDRLLDGKIVTGEYRALQSVLRLLTLLPTNRGFEYMGPAGEPIIAAQFAPHNEGDMCTACGRLQHATYVG